MKKLYFIYFILLICHNTRLNAQGNPVLKGRTLDRSTEEPIEFVNVILKKETDSMLISHVTTDRNGNYVFGIIGEGKYFLQASFIGYETVVISSINIISGKPVQLPEIFMNPVSTLLDDVVITDEKALTESHIDKRVYNVGKDIIAATGSASDVLDNVPSVSVDLDGNVSLRGSPNVNIFINGRPSALMRINGALALQQIPANMIERIEIISNPSAKYKPDGSSGIINLVLKKEQRPGMNGIIAANAGNDQRYNASLNINYKPSKINLFASYAFRHDHRLRNATDLRWLYDSFGVLTSTYDYYSSTDFSPKAHTINTGFDYAIDNSSEIGLSCNFFILNFLRNEQAYTKIRNNQNVLTTGFERMRTESESEFNNEMNLHYEKRFQREDHELTFDFSYDVDREEEDNLFHEIYSLPPVEPRDYKVLNIQKEKVGNAELEYTYPFSEDAGLEFGMASDWMHQEFDYSSEYFDPLSMDWTDDVSKNSLFQYREFIQSGYLTYQQSLDKFGYKLGLRGESATISSNLYTLDSIVNQNYFRIYPSLHLSYELNEATTLKMSYSRRINRPEGDELNPFPVYEDPRNLFSGNPYLDPENIHSLEFGLQYQNKQFTISPVLYYRYRYDGFTEVSSYINDSTLLTTTESIATGQSGGLEFALSWNFRKLMRLAMSGNFFYNQIDASNLGFSENKEALSGNLKLNGSLSFSETTLFQFNTHYRLSELTPQGTNLPGFAINAGFRQELFNKKASVLLTVSDIFNTLRWRSEIDTPELVQRTNFKRKSQIVYLGFSYRFGKQTKKQIEEFKFDDQR